MNPDIQRMLKELEAIATSGQAVCAGLSDAQFNGHPAPGRWVRAQLAERVRRADGLDLTAIRVVSPANRWVRMPVGAYFEFILAHDRRHLWQARKVRGTAA